MSEDVTTPVNDPTGNPFPPKDPPPQPAEQAPVEEEDTVELLP